MENPKISSDYIAKIKTELQLLMRQNAGIVRYDTDLRKAKEKLMQWQDELKTILKNFQISTELYELYNMITIGNLIVQQSIKEMRITVVLRKIINYKYNFNKKTNKK